MIPFKKLAFVPILAALVVAGCSSGSPIQTPPAATSVVAGATSTLAPASGSTVMAASAGGSTVLVAGANGMTVYAFSNDSANSGTSACTGTCATKWPPLTVPAGTTPTAGSGVSGKLGTITRTDNGAVQVTYNGLPLYFYSGDKAVGDTNGNYPGWNLVKP